MSESFTCPFQRGDVINGKYRVEELIAVGGVGFVLSAAHLHLEESVALKLLKPEFATHRNAMRSFALEARASFRIRSEHIARVHDVDTLPSGVPFMVMELLRGEDLRKILMHYRALPIGLSVDIALQTCEALAAAHAHQIVHRDIKPENLFVTQAGDAPNVKVLDFGISQVLAAAVAGQAKSGRSPSLVAVGTPPYMSPEQIRGSVGLDARADLWSLGCVLYEMLAGVAPFARSSVMQACAAVLEEQPAALRDRRSDVPAELDAAVMRCLEKEPAKRFANAAELADALSPFGKHAVHCAQRCATLLAPPVRRSEPAQQPQLSVAPRQDGRVPTGVAGRIPTGVAGRIPTGVAGRIPTGVAGRIPTGVAGRIPTGVAGRMPTGVPAQTARVPTSSVALSTRVRRSTIDPLSAPVAGPQQSMVAPVRRIPTAHDLAVTAPSPAPVKTDEPIDDRLDTVPGLRPRSVNWLILSASALILFGFAYFALAH